MKISEISALLDKVKGVAGDVEVAFRNIDNNDDIRTELKEIELALTAGEELVGNVVTIAHGAASVVLDPTGSTTSVVGSGDISDAPVNPVAGDTSSTD
jgi:hypothetical protein